MRRRAFIDRWDCWALLDQPWCVSEHIFVREKVVRWMEKKLMGPSPTDNGEESVRGAVGLSRDGGPPRKDEDCRTR